MAWLASREAHSAEQVRLHDREIGRVMRDIAGDAWVLSEVVAGGPLLWRRQFLSTMHAAGLPLVDAEVADRLFAFFSLRLQALAGSDRDAQALASHFLDALEVDERRPPTAQEIAASLELESGSSPEGQRFFYGGKTKDDVMRALHGEVAATMDNPLSES